MIYHDIIVIGAGPAGLAAAIAAREAGVENILVLERDSVPGGILNQCIHNGFGLHTFQEELTGPEYAQRYIDRATALGIAIRLNTMVLSVSEDREVLCSSREHGLERMQAGALILCMGCRERPRGALGIPGTRPAGIYSAGAAQRLVNVEGYLPGKEVVILGSGDIGLIMARRMTLEGARVKCVCELMPYSGGLKRNIVQCLHDYGIPLRLSHTVVEIHGRERLEAVTIAAVDEQRRPIAGTEEYIPCDTLLLSVGLLPENELSEGAGLRMDSVTGGAVVAEDLQSSVPGIFACGNVLHVHDLVDFVSEEAARAGRSAAAFLKHRGGDSRLIPLRAGPGVRYTVPQYIRADAAGEVTVRFRVAEPRYNSRLVCRADGETVIRKKRPVVTPGEMEELTLKPEQFAAAREIVIALEEL
ncbi:MAG: FAD-binding protein [Ruminococcaceae bacterium]|nr:FAD-binding protein [Oscillospiraceae bacterium]